MTVNRPSLEALIETGMLRLDSLHPGGLSLTRELIELCNVTRDARVLDVAAGTGETACLLAERFGARVTVVDRSPAMVRQAEAKARERGLAVECRVADAHSLPFGDGAFDAVMCECTLCFLDKDRVLGEMVRVVRPGGRVGMHDLCWRDGAPEGLKRSLADLEDERPETLDGWQRLFAGAGLADVVAIDKSALKARWMRDSHRALGLLGEVGLGLRIIRRWGLSGLWTVLRSERVFSSTQLGYAIVVGTRPAG